MNISILLCGTPTKMMLVHVSVEILYSNLECFDPCKFVNVIDEEVHKMTFCILFLAVIWLGVHDYIACRFLLSPMYTIRLIACPLLPLESAAR